MKGARTGLKVFGCLYVIFAFLLVAFTIIAFTSQKFFKELIQNINYDFKDANSKLVLGLTYGFLVLISVLIDCLIIALINKVKIVNR